MTIKITAELPDTTSFVKGTPLELAGRVYAVLGDKAWEEAIGMFLVQWASPNRETQSPLSYAIEAGLRHGATFLSEEDQVPVTAHMMRSLDALQLDGLVQKVSRWWSFKRR